MSSEENTFVNNVNNVGFFNENTPAYTREAEISQRDLVQSKTRTENQSFSLTPGAPLCTADSEVWAHASPAVEVTPDVKGDVLERHQAVHTAGST